MEFKELLVILLTVLRTCWEKLWLMNVASSARLRGELRLLASSWGGSTDVSFTVNRSVHHSTLLIIISFWNLIKWRENYCWRSFSSLSARVPVLWRTHHSPKSTATLYLNSLSADQFCCERGNLIWIGPFLAKRKDQRNVFCIQVFAFIVTLYVFIHFIVSCIW